MNNKFNIKLFFRLLEFVKPYKPNFIFVTIAAILISVFSILSQYLLKIGVDDYKKVWEDQIRFAGVGAMVVGGVYTLWSMRKTIAEGLSKAFKKGNDGEVELRTEMDLT